MLIENCSINMYALKMLVKWVSPNLINLTIINCDFYVNDNSALKQKSSTKQTNNKMLRELNFSFLVKSIGLPHIESINLQLKEGSQNEEEKE